MKTVDQEYARRHFCDLFTEVSQSKDTVAVRRSNGGSVALISLNRYNEIAKAIGRKPAAVKRKVKNSREV